MPRRHDTSRSATASISGARSTARRLLDTLALGLHDGAEPTWTRDPPLIRHGADQEIPRPATPPPDATVATTHRQPHLDITVTWTGCFLRRTVFHFIRAWLASWADPRRFGGCRWFPSDRLTSRPPDASRPSTAGFLVGGTTQLPYRVVPGGASRSLFCTANAALASGTATGLRQRTNVENATGGREPTAWSASPPQYSTCGAWHRLIVWPPGADHACRRRRRGRDGLEQRCAATFSDSMTRRRRRRHVAVHPAGTPASTVFTWPAASSRTPQTSPHQLACSISTSGTPGRYRQRRRGTEPPPRQRPTGVASLTRLNLTGFDGMTSSSSSLPRPLPSSYTSIGGNGIRRVQGLRCPLRGTFTAGGRGQHHAGDLPLRRSPNGGSVKDTFNVKRSHRHAGGDGGHAPNDAQFQRSGRVRPGRPHPSGRIRDPAPGVHLSLLADWTVNTINRSRRGVDRTGRAGRRVLYHVAKGRLLHPVHNGAGVFAGSAAVLGRRLAGLPVS